MQSSRQSASKLNPSYQKQHSGVNIKPDDADKSLVFKNSSTEQKSPMMMRNPHHVTFFDRKRGEDNSFFNITYIPSSDVKDTKPARIAAINPMCTTDYLSIEEKIGIATCS